jgi:hypothetical protein
MRGLTRTPPGPCGHPPWRRPPPWCRAGGWRSRRPGSRAPQRAAVRGDGEVVEPREVPAIPRRGRGRRREAAAACEVEHEGPAVAVLRAVGQVGDARAVAQEARSAGGCRLACGTVVELEVRVALAVPHVQGAIEVRALAREQQARAPRRDVLDGPGPRGHREALDGAAGDLRRPQRPGGAVVRVAAEVDAIPLPRPHDAPVLDALAAAEGDRLGLLGGDVDEEEVVVLVPSVVVAHDDPGPVRGGHAGADGRLAVRQLPRGPALGVGHEQLGHPPAPAEEEHARPVVGDPDEARSGREEERGRIGRAAASCRRRRRRRRGGGRRPHGPGGGATGGRPPAGTAVPRSSTRQASRRGPIRRSIPTTYWIAFVTSAGNENTRP